jgi:hypothetical protein
MNEFANAISCTTRPKKKEQRAPHMKLALCSYILSVYSLLYEAKLKGKAKNFPASPFLGPTKVPL